MGTIRLACRNAGEHLDGMKKVAKELFPGQDLGIKDQSEISMAKLLNSIVVTGICNGATELNNNLADAIKKEVKAEWYRFKAEQD